MLGDPTPARLGMLSFNPVRHVDPVGTLAIPSMLALIGAPVFGWGKAIPIHGENFRHPRADAAVVAVVGPLVAFLIAAIAAVAIAAMVDANGDGPVAALPGYLFDCLIRTLLTGCVLAIFNLLPIPGLDGGKIVEALLPRATAEKFASLGQYSLLILVALVVIMPMLSPQTDTARQVIRPLSPELARLFLWGAGVPFAG